MNAWIKAEEEFESWYALRKSAFVYKFEDARMVMGVNRSKSVTAHGQPADYIITDNGICFWAEVKSSQNPASFPLSNITKSQWNGCRQVVAAGGQYWFFICKEPEREWYKIPASFFIAIHKENVKSVPWFKLMVFRKYD